MHPEDTVRDPLQLYIQRALSRDHSGKTAVNALATDRLLQHNDQNSMLFRLSQSKSREVVEGGHHEGYFELTSPQSRTEVQEVHNMMKSQVERVSAYPSIRLFEQSQDQGYVGRSRVRGAQESRILEIYDQLGKVGSEINQMRKSLRQSIEDAESYQIKSQLDCTQCEACSRSRRIPGLRNEQEQIIIEIFLDRGLLNAEDILEKSIRCAHSQDSSLFTQLIRSAKARYFKNKASISDRQYKSYTPDSIYSLETCVSKDQQSSNRSSKQGSNPQAFELKLFKVQHSDKSNELAAVRQRHVKFSAPEPKTEQNRGNAVQNHSGDFEFLRRILQAQQNKSQSRRQDGAQVRSALQFNRTISPKNRCKN